MTKLRKNIVTACVVLAGAVSQFGANSTLVGVADWSDFGTLDSAPPVNFFVGTWTHVCAPMGSGGKGNDYPFGEHRRGPHHPNTFAYNLLTEEP